LDYSPKPAASHVMPCSSSPLLALRTTDPRELPFKHLN
jgi:hypothetical protein